MSDPAPVLAIVDDNAEYRGLLGKIARQEGWAPHEFATGTTMVRALDSGLSPDAIFLDIFMDDCDGLGVLRHLHQIGASVPVIVISGSTGLYSDTARVFGAASGVNVVDVLRKPVPISTISSVLAAIARS